jgi:uncharacterized SAM-binding protein YcdF (DUF218 family)
LIKDLLLPPVGLFLLLAAAIVIAVRRPRAARWITAAALIALWLLSTSVVSNALERSLSRFPPLNLRQPVVDAQAIIILGGGVRNGTEFGTPSPNEHTLQRLLFGARVARVTQLPVLVSGGTGLPRAPVAEVMKSFLVNSFHIPVEWVESVSRNTRENALMSRRMLLSAGVTRVILVTSNVHMHRAVLEFEAAGFKVVPAPTVLPPPGDVELREFSPNPEALLRSYYSLYEWVGLCAAKARLAIRS